MVNRPSLEDIIGILFPQGIPDHVGERLPANFGLQGLTEGSRNIVNVLLDLRLNPNYSSTVANAYHSAFYDELLMQGRAANDLYKSAAVLVLQQERQALSKLKRLKLWKEMQKAESEKEIFPRGVGYDINASYVTYLLRLGVPAGKITWSRKFLLARDANLAQISGRRSIDEVEPKGFGPYAVLVYPLRLAVRHFMLRGAGTQRHYDLTSGPTAGPSGS